MVTLHRREVLRGAALAALALGVAAPVAYARLGDGRSALRRRGGGAEVTLEPFANRLTYQTRGAERWVHDEAGAAPWQLNRPYGVAVAADGRLAVANTGNDEVLLFDADGRRLARYGGLGGPRDVAWDPAGRLIVVETRRRQVTLLDAGRPVLTVTEGLAGPVAVALEPEGGLIVADVSAAALARFTSDGRRLGQYPIGGRVHGVHCDDAGRLYVAVDGGVRRVVVT